MLKRFEQFIEKHKLCLRDNKIIVAVSGGLDSMVMLDLFQRSRYNIVVAHVNFQLRGIESDRDESFVVDHCRQHGIPLQITRVETNNYATQRRVSVQMAARDLRYEWFARLVGEGIGDLVATGHHLSDSVETTLLRLVHGGGADSLSGIPVINGHVIRPLMFATRSEIEVYAGANQITWREDLSNQTLDYQRNVIRHLVLPPLRSINPDLEETLQRTALRSKGGEELIDAAVRIWKERFAEESNDTLALRKEGFNVHKYPQALLFKILSPYGFNFANCMDIADSMWGQAGKKFMSATHQLVIDRECLLVGSLALSLDAVSIELGENRSEMGPFQIQIQERLGNDIDADPSVAVLDKDKVSFPLQWRTWKEGDFFFPLGMKGRKKVSDFLIDLKLSVPEKQTVTVIESDSGIVWLPGLRVDDRFKVTSQTRTSLVLSLQKR